MKQLTSVSFIHGNDTILLQVRHPGITIADDNISANRFTGMGTAIHGEILAEKEFGPRTPHCEIGQPDHQGIGRHEVEGSLYR